MNLKKGFEEFLRYRNAYFLAISVSTVFTCFGWDTGLIGGVLALPSFQQFFELEDNSMAVRAALSGNIVSIFQAGGLFGSLVSMWSADRYGRKPPLVVSAVIFIAGNIIQSITGLGSTPAVGLKILYFGRFVGGVGVGQMTALAATYISECAPRTIRGRCTGCIELSFGLGGMLSFWVNYGVAVHIPTENIQWRLPFIIQIIPGVILLILMAPQPESPRWLVEKGRHDDAAKSLAYIARTDPSAPEVQATLAEIRADFTGRHQLSLWSQLHWMGENKTIAYRCFAPSLLLFFQQWTGTNAINYYSPQIFASLGLSSVMTSLFVVGIYGIIKYVSTPVALMFVVESWGRKRTLFYGGLVQALMMFWIGGFIAVHPQSKIVPATYLSIIAVYLFGISFTFGWGPTPSILASEIAPSHLRQAVMALAVSTTWLFIYVIAQVMPRMLDTITWGTYIVFGGVNAMMAVYAWIGIPETTGVALEDVGRLFEGPGVLMRFVKDAPGGRWMLRRLGILDSRARSSTDPVQLRQSMEAGSVGEHTVLARDGYDASNDGQGKSERDNDALII